MSDDSDFEMSTGACLSHILHHLALRGVKLVQEGAGVPQYIEASGATVVPNDPALAVVKLSQLLFDRDPSGLHGNAIFEAIARRAAALGKAVDRGGPTLGNDGQLWQNGSRVEAAK